MYDLIVGPFNGQAWIGSTGQQLVFHHDWSRVVFDATFLRTQEMPCFDYAKGSTGFAGFAAVNAVVPGTTATRTDTSLNTPNRTSLTCVLTHLGVRVEMRMRGVTILGGAYNDIPLVTEADYRQLAYRLRYAFFWASDTLREAEGHIEDFPPGYGTDHFSQRANEFQANNGAPVWSNRCPFRRPLFCDKGQTLIKGTYTPDENGGVQPTTDVSLMADIWGVLAEPAT